MARSSVRAAAAMERIASVEREKVSFLRWLASLFSGSGAPGKGAPARRYGDGGGMGDHVLPRGGGSPSPGGNFALPGQRPCINVTPDRQPTKRKATHDR